MMNNILHGRIVGERGDPLPNAFRSRGPTEIKCATANTVIIARVCG